MSPWERCIGFASDGESKSARVSAACALLDRGHGKPKQRQEVTLDGSECFLQIWRSISEGQS